MEDVRLPPEFIVTLSLRFKPGLRAGALARLAPAVELTRAEPGNIAFEVFTVRDDPDWLVLPERWKDQAAPDWHFNQPYLREVLALFSETLAEPIAEGGNVLYLADALANSRSNPA